MQAFLFFVKFTVFVSVEQGDINKLCFCVSEKVYLGYTAATKSCYPKKEKRKSRAKKVKHDSLFFQKSLFSSFFQSSWISSPPVLDVGGRCKKVLF